MSEGVVLTSIDSRGIAEVILNRPERNNAYNGTMIDELIKSFTSLYNNDDVRVVLIRGNGKHFQGGADLEWLKEIGKLNKEENIEVSRKTASAIKGLTEFPKPTIAMIHGGCFGGGTGIAAAADIVVASEDAIFSIAEARWGVMAGIIIPHLNSSIGVRNVRRYALTCERFNAHEAKNIGLNLDEVIKSFLEDLKRTKYLVGHNVKFDINIIIFFLKIISVPTLVLEGELKKILIIHLVKEIPSS